VIPHDLAGLAAAALALACAARHQRAAGVGEDPEAHLDALEEDVDRWLALAGQQAEQAASLERLRDTPEVRRTAFEAVAAVYGVEQAQRTSVCAFGEGWRRFGFAPLVGGFTARTALA